MTLSPSNTAVDRTGRELVEHGTAAFPIACYHDDLLVEEVLWHWHEELEAGIITEGTAVITIGQEKHIVSAGEGFFINSGILHGAYSLDRSSCLIHSLVFHPRLVGGSSDSIFYQRYLRPLTGDPTLDWIHLSPEISWQSEALSALEDTWYSCMKEEEGYDFHVRSTLSTLVFLLCRNHPKSGHQPSTKALRDGERIKKMLSCIHEYYGSELNVQTIAASASISESECLRCFRGTIGISPIQYLKQHRLRQAAAQILSTSEKVSDIAERCGFQDISYFTKSFREMFGCTPTEYRHKKSQP